jgi:outer membrane protein assembly factor BamA
MKFRSAFFLIYALLLVAPIFHMPIFAQKVRIDSVLFKGNERTKASILKRELDFQEGDSLQLDQVEKQLEVNRRKLMNTNLFIWTKFDFHHSKSGGLVIQFEFLEQFYTLIFPIFSLADRNLSDWVNRGADPKRIVYGIRATQSNLTGRNEKLSINLATGFSQRFDILYSNPYINKRKTNGIYVGYTYQSSKNLAYNSKVDVVQFASSSEPLLERNSAILGFRKRVKFYDFSVLEARYHQVRLSDSAFALNNQFLPGGTIKSNYFQFTYGFSYDKRDFTAYPLRGKKIDFLMGYYAVPSSSRSNFYEVVLGYERFIPLGNQFYFSTSHRLKFTQDGKTIPYYLMAGLGYGNNVVRGYEFNVVDGNQFYLNRNTFKFQLINKIFKVPFLPLKQFNQIPIGLYPTAYLDFGYVNIGQENNFNSKLAGKLLYGYGLGFDLVTYYNLVAKVIFPVVNGSVNGFRVSVGREF